MVNIKSTRAAELLGRRSWYLLALLVAIALGMIVLAVRGPGDREASAEGVGYAAGNATVAIGEATLQCTWKGSMDGTSTPATAEDGSDASDVQSELNGQGECPEPSAKNLAGRLFAGANGVRAQDPLTQEISADFSGQIVEQSSDGDDILEYPADATYEVLLRIGTTSIGDVHNTDSEPMLLDCPDIEDDTRYSCSLREGTTVDLYDPTEENVMATLTEVKLNFDRDDRDVPPPNGGGGTDDGDDDNLLVIGGIVLAIVAVIAIGAGVYAVTRRAA